MQLSSRRKSPSPWRDMRRDWQRWSRLERLTAGAFSFGTLATLAIYVMIGG